jgi:DNA-binding IclR family transcriptional regulator
VLANDDALLRTVCAAPLPAFTVHTVTSTKSLVQRLELVHERGWAWAFEEFADGMNSVAAAVRDGHGRVIAALHVYGPATRFPGDRNTDDVGRALLAAAGKIRID